MKKLSFFVITFVLTFLFVKGQSITITSPSAGDNWHFGESRNITWTKSGVMNTQVKIRLFNEAGVRILSIVDTTDNDGVYENWVIPETLSPGNYTILVRTIENRVSDNSGIFTLGEGLVSEGRIEVLLPNSSTAIPSTRVSTSITWNDYGELPENVSITLFTDGSPSRSVTLAFSTPNDGEYNWLSPGSHGAGRYFIRVKTADSTVWGDSELFEILPSPPPDVRINVTGPGTGEDWIVESPRMIYWRNTGEMNDRVKIELYNHTGSIIIRTLFDNTENNENQHWIVPADHDTGRFVIKVTTIDNAVTGSSGIFNITRPDDPESSSTTPSARASSSTMKIKSPNKNSVWKTGQKGKIVWAKNPLVHNRVGIELFKKGILRAVQLISGNTANDGNFTWSIPNSLTAGKYFIKITTMNKAVYCTSETFIIKSKRVVFKKKK